MLAVADQTTVHLIAVDSKEGKSFLRRVVRDNDWRAHAGPSSDWKLCFTRTIRGAVGESDRTIDVMTDAVVRISGKTGMVQSFSDSQPVQVCTIRRISLGSSDTAAAAMLLADGARLSARSSAGSTASSKLGLSFYSLSASLPKLPYGEVEIGGQTVAHDGRTIVCGAVDIY